MKIKDIFQLVSDKWAGHILTRRVQIVGTARLPAVVNDKDGKSHVYYYMTNQTIAHQGVAYPIGNKKYAILIRETNTYERPSVSYPNTYSEHYLEEIPTVLTLVEACGWLKKIESQLMAYQEGVRIIVPADRVNGMLHFSRFISDEAIISRREMIVSNA